MAHPPLPPEDRLWRHPSELGGGTPAPAAWATPPPSHQGRGPNALLALGAACLAGAVVAVGVMWFTRPTKVVVEWTVEDRYNKAGDVAVLSANQIEGIRE